MSFLSRVLPAALLNWSGKREMIGRKPTLAGLSYALRHPVVWPKGFWWSYKDCNLCAIELAYLLWSSIARRKSGSRLSADEVQAYHASAMARAFGIPFETSREIFFRAYKNGDGLLMRMEEVTPDHVADMIDAYLATDAEV